MVRPQQAACADVDGDVADPAAPSAAVVNGECRLQTEPALVTAAPAADRLARYTPSPHSQGSASPPQGTASPHVVLLHIVDGESIQFQRGDNVELIQGPATVQMVSTNPSPPMPYPVQVPPGHMMQQVVDGMGTLRHVILSQEPRGMPHMPPYSTSQPPPPYYPPPPPQGFAPQFPPHAMYSPTPSGVMPAGTAMPQGPSPPPPAHHSYGKDQRSHVRVKRMQRKLNERQRQRQPAAGSRTSPSQSPSPGEHKNGVAGRRPASEPEENGEPSGGSTSSVCSQMEDDERLTAEFLSKLKPPQVSELTAGSALVTWAHPDVTVDQLSIPPDQLSYELSLAELRASGSAAAPLRPPPLAAYRRVFVDRAVSTQLNQLRPGTAYSIILQGSLGVVQGSRCPPVIFTTLAAAPNQPLPPTMQNKTKTSLHVRWSAPHDNGARITQYVLECDSGDGYSEAFRGRSKQHNVTHLQAATSYRLRVSAINEAGQSAPSEPVALQTSGCAPPPPTPPQLTEAMATALTLSWQRRASDDSFTLHMEEERSQYGFLALYSGADCSYQAPGLRRNTRYKFKLRAINEEGCSRWSEPVSYRTGCEPPQPPSKPVVRGRIHAHQFRLRWEPPQDTGGAAVAAFRLELDKGSGMQEIYAGADQERTVEGLEPGTTYQLQVRCEGDGGVSDPSEPGTVTTEPVCPGRCAAPRLHGKPRANSCHVKWGFPEYSGGSLGSLVTKFELDLTLPDSTTSRAYSGHDTECTVSSLLPGRPYLIQVRAVNRVGAGQWSEPLRLTSGAGPPDAPAAPDVTARSPHVLLVRWREPVTNGASIAEYRLECSSGGATAFQPIYTAAGTQYEARGLQPATAYRFRVGAANAAGAGPPSEPTVAVTPAASPAAVVVVYAEPTATSIAITWEPPADHGAEILHYTVELSDRLYSTTGPQTQLTVADLTPDIVYRIRVQAVNNVGPGPFSGMHRWSTLSLPPPPPPLEVTHTAHNFVRLRWGDAKQQTDRIVYSLECEAKNGEFYVVYEGSGTQFKMARLAEDTEYRFRICAANEAGDGPYSNVLSSRTTQPPPPTVRGLRVGERTERSCVLEWLPAKLSSGQPADGLSYQLQLLAPHRDAEFHRVYTGPDVTNRVMALEPQHDYQARVCCQTANGVRGPFTAVQRFSTPATPVVPAVTRANSQHTHRVSEKKPWTEQQWAVAILGAFGVVALLLAVLVQQAMVLLS